MNLGDVLKIAVAAGIGWWVWHELNTTVQKAEQNLKPEAEQKGSLLDQLAASDAG